MHILMVSDVYFPRFNGVSTSIQSFARVFVALGHRVTLIAPDYPPNAPGPSPVHADLAVDAASGAGDGIEVLRVAASRVPFDPEDRLMSWRAVRRLLPGLCGRGIDVVHVQTPFVAHIAGVRIARLLQVRLVVSYHTFFEAYFEQYLPWAPRAWLRGIARYYSLRQCNQADAVVAPSTQMRDRLNEYGVSRPVRVVPTGLPPTAFERVADNGFRRRHGLPDDAFILLYLGRVAFEKNIAFLIEMFVDVRRRVAGSLLVIAGEGPARQDLRRRAAGLGLGDDVRFVGYLDRDTELRDCYQACDLFVFASETETQGLVLLEAMASGLPVVSTVEMGTRDVLRDGEGCLVAPPEAGPFADRVVRVHDDCELRTGLAQSAVAYARKWRAESKADEMLALYGELLDTADAAAAGGCP
jgi:1,2-diacylglycerol 3-alpha-glucosyltransferase